MARTLDQCIASIITDLNRGSEYSARVKEAIVDAIAFYAPTRLGFNTAIASVSWSESTYQALPDNWLEMDYVRLTATSYREPLEERSTAWMNELDIPMSPILGRPNFYCIETRQIRVYPKPDQDYGATVAYLVALPEVSLSADGTVTNAWLDEGWPLIKARASIDLIENYLGGEELMQRVGRLMMREDTTLDSMKRRANREQGSGHVEPYL